MSNGTASIPSRIFLALVIAALFALTGCNEPATPSSLPHAGAVTLPVPSGIGPQRADPARNRVWVLGPQSVFLRDSSMAKPVEVTLPSWQWVDTPYGCPPDLALGPDGEAVVSSNVVPVLWRIDPETLAVSRHELALDADTDKDVGFSRLVYSAEHGLYFAVNAAHGSLWEIDRSLRTARKVAQLVPVREACSAALPGGSG